MNKWKSLFIGVLLALSISTNIWAADVSALQLVKQGNQYVGVQSKDKLVGIHSEKSVATLTPNIWYVVYYDPDSTFKAVEVKFGAGQKLDVSHPARIIEMATSDHTTMDTGKLKVDSDRALSIAKSQPLLNNLKLTASQMWLEHGDTGPQWRVKFWAEKLRNPSQDADIGVVIVSATDGSLVKTDLHPNSVD